MLTTRVTVKFGDQGIGENRRDLPACCCTPHRKIDGFMGNLAEHSKEGTPWRQLWAPLGAKHVGLRPMRT
jgi:hypothetical protein